MPNENPQWLEGLQKALREGDAACAGMVAGVDEMADALNSYPPARSLAAPLLPYTASLRRRIAVAASSLARLEKAITGEA